MDFKSRPCSVVSVVLLVILGCALGQASVFEGSQQEVNVKVRSRLAIDDSTGGG